MRKSLSTCPTCGGKLKISQYRCDECDIDISGEFEGCSFCDLSDEDRYFALIFLQTGGNIKDVERVMGISYPTVKAKLHNLIVHLGLANGDEHYHDHHSARAAAKQAKREVKHALRNLKVELKGVKRGIKDGRKHRRGIHVFGQHIHPPHEVPEDGVKSRRESVDATSVINDLKDGKIDVDAAISRLKGEDAVIEKAEGESEITADIDINES